VPQEPFLPAQDPSQISAPPNRSGPPEQPLPGSGEGVFSFDRSACWSQLNIVPRAYQGHLVVKVEDWNSSVLVCWFFIREGQSAETPIPAGSCRLKIASGKKWYGENELFGPEGSYSTVTTEIRIPEPALYTISLTPSLLGTLRERALRRQDF